MARAIKCDRCGKLYEKNKKELEYEGRDVVIMGVEFVVGGYMCSRGHRDLCDSCLDLLCDFLNITNALDEPGLNVTDEK